MMEIFYNIIFFIITIMIIGWFSQYLAKKDKNYNFQDHHDFGIFCEKFFKISFGLTFCIIIIFTILTFFNISFIKTEDTGIFISGMILVLIPSWILGETHWMIG
jgi:tetrahydromethanopterin S-methyltransferase subunit E